MTPLFTLARFNSFGSTLKARLVSGNFYIVCYCRGRVGILLMQYACRKFANPTTTANGSWNDSNDIHLVLTPFDKLQFVYSDHESDKNRKAPQGVPKLAGQASFNSLSMWFNYPFFIFLCPKIVSMKKTPWTIQIVSVKFWLCPKFFLCFLKT